MLRTLALGSTAALLSFSLSSFAAPDSDHDAAVKLMQLQRTELTSAERQVVDAMLDSGLGVQQSLVRAGTDTTTSPFSLSSAFGLVLNGVRGQTLAEVSGRLYNGMSVESFNAGYAGIARRLAAIGRENTLSFGNAVFVDRDFAILPEYEQRVGRFLGARAQALNFRDEQATVNAINEYIEQQTHQMIRRMLSSAPERAALVNAGYFKGAWDFRFETKNTREEADFDTGNGKKKLPLMLQREKTFLYFRGEGFQMASLAYKNGEFAMDLIVPDRTSDVRAAAAAVQRQLTGPAYREWIRAAEPRVIHLGLPRFETSFKEELTPFYQRQLPTAFSGLADFGAMTRERVAISNVVHATKLKVNEEGTEGAFATVIGIKATSIGVEPRTPEVIADRPFLFVIRHTATGTPIFVGSISDPQPLARP